MILSFWAMGIAWFWLVWSNLLNDHKVYHVHWFNEWHSELQILEHGGRKSTMYFSNTHSELFTTSSRWYQRPHKIKHAFDLLIIIPIFFCKEKTTSFPTLCLKISIYPNSNSNANITEHSLTKKKKKRCPSRHYVHSNQCFSTIYDEPDAEKDGTMAVKKIFKRATSFVILLVTSNFAQKWKN